MKIQMIIKLFVCLFRNGGSIVRHGYGKKDGNFVDVGGKIVTDIR